MVYNIRYADTGFAYRMRLYVYRCVTEGEVPACNSTFLPQQNHQIDPERPHWAEKSYGFVRWTTPDQNPASARPGKEILSQDALLEPREVIQKSNDSLENKGKSRVFI